MCDLRELSCNQVAGELEEVKGIVSPIRARLEALTEEKLNSRQES